MDFLFITIIKNQRIMKTLSVKILMMASVICFVAERLYAQDSKSDTPVPVQNLMKFLGNWEANAKLTTGGKTYNVLYRVNCKKTADGNGLYADEEFSNAELGTMKGADLAGFDPYDSKIKWFSVDNMGTTHEHTGDWQSSDHLYIEHTGLHDGKKYVEKIDFIFKGKDVLEFRLTGSLDGVETEKGEAVFHKK